jgi:hypothetical protein
MNTDTTLLEELDAMSARVVALEYEYHQPLYRQEEMFRQQFGVELSRKTIGCWVEQAAELLKPVYRSIREDLLAGNYLQADETPIRYLDPDVKGKSQQGCLWVYSRPKSDVLFEWRVSRSRAGPALRQAMRAWQSQPVLICSHACQQQKLPRSKNSHQRRGPRPTRRRK